MAADDSLPVGAERVLHSGPQGDGIQHPGSVPSLTAGVTCKSFANRGIFCFDYETSLEADDRKKAVS